MDLEIYQILTISLENSLVDAKWEEGRSEVQTALFANIAKDCLAF